jgi:DNA (cytosine-5)-methyltransferase 1
MRLHPISATVHERMPLGGWRLSENAVLPAVVQTGVGFIDLFAGCGGLALGFATEGLQPISAVEFDPAAAETYRLNIDPNIAVSDIAQVRGWPQAEVVIGGPPCQGFSQLGTRDPDDPRNRLWQEYVRVLDESNADLFVMENVPQLLRSMQFELFREETERRGFNIASRVLCAADYGVPQMRRRAIVIGSRLGTPTFPLETHGPRSPEGRPYVSVRQALDGPPALPEIPDGINWHTGRPHIRPSSVTRYQAVPPDGGNRFQMQDRLDAAGLPHLVPACWRRKKTGTTDVFGRLWWGRPALTIRTEFFKPEKGRYLHPTAHRPITVREAARLQSFPDTFEFLPQQSIVSVAKQIGNAVPPLLAGAIARAVLEHLWIHGRLASLPPTVRGMRQLELVG